MTEKKSISEFTDRELLETILSNQIQIFREIRSLEEFVKTGKQKGRGQFWISFKWLYGKKQETIRQVNAYLNDKENLDDNYNAEEQGEG